MSFLKLSTEIFRVTPDGFPENSGQRTPAHSCLTHAEASMILLSRARRPTSSWKGNPFLFKFKDWKLLTLVKKILN